MTNKLGPSSCYLIRGHGVGIQCVLLSDCRRGLSLVTRPNYWTGVVGCEVVSSWSKRLCLLTQYWKAAAHKNTLPQGVTTYTSEDSCEIGQLWGEGPSRVIALKSLHFTWNLFALGTRAILNFNWWWTVWLGVSLCLWVSSELRQIIRVLDLRWEDWSSEDKRTTTDVGKKWRHRE